MNSRCRRCFRPCSRYRGTSPSAASLFRKLLVTLGDAGLYIAFRIQLARFLPERSGCLQFGLMIRSRKLILAGCLPGQARPHRLAGGRFSQLPGRVVRHPRDGTLRERCPPRAESRMPASPAARSPDKASQRRRSGDAQPQGFQYHAQPAPDRKAPRPRMADLPLPRRCVLL